MDTSWIQVFVLTLAECVAPAGKTVCQEQQFELLFLSNADCSYALQQLIELKDEAENVIVDRRKSGCSPSAIEVEAYENLGAINSALGDKPGWRTAEAPEARRAAVTAEHRDRLAALKSCDDTNGVAPCKIGQIIVEEASGDSVEIWKRD